MIHTIETGLADLLLVKVPSDLHRCYLNSFGLTGISFSHGTGPMNCLPNIPIPNPDQYLILCKFSRLTEPIVEKLVPRHMIDGKEDGYSWKNYSGDDILITASQSFYSCLHVHGLLTKQPIKPQFSALAALSPAVDTDTPIQDYKKAMDHYIDPETTMILIKKAKKHAK